MGITIAAIAKEVVVSLMTKPIIGGVAKIFKDTPEKKAVKALKKALDEVACDNGCWKSDVIIQASDVIEILLQIMDVPNYLEKNTLPHYLDKETIIRFEKCLRKDHEAWNYIEGLLQEKRLRETRDYAKENNEILREFLNEKDAKTITHFLTINNPGKADSSNVIGREEDLSKLWNTLSEPQHHHVILTGFGGIGKTKLAQMLFHAYENEFDEIAWIEYQGDLKKSFWGSITAPELQFEGNEDDKWKAMKNALTNDGKKKLFIIDNVDHIENQNPEQDTELHHLTGWSNTTVLLTSRLPRLENYTQLSLDFLDKEDCIKVFNHYYPGKKTLDQTTVADLVELANRHTLTIELLAKGAWQYNLNKYYEIVKQGFNQVDEAIQTTYHEREEDTIEGHLRFLFSMKDRSELEKRILNSFAILPDKCRCTKEELENWFGFKKKDWNALLKDGWLSYDEESETYFMHPLVRTIIRFDFAEDAEQKGIIAPKGTADKILEFFETHEEQFRISQGYISLQRIIKIAVSVMDSISNEKTRRFAIINNRIGLGKIEIGDYDSALEFLFKAQSFFESNNYQVDTADTYNSIGLAYWHKTQYKDSLDFHFKAKVIREEVLGKEHPTTAKTYNNIGIVYDEQDNYEEALKYYRKALPIFEKPGTEPRLTAAINNNVGKVYRDLENYEEALKYFYHALEVLGPNHSDTGSFCNNIGMVYFQLGEYGKALVYLPIALAIRVKAFGTKHSYTATSLDSIGLVYCKRCDYVQALEYHLKALEIREKVFGKDHPSTATSYNEIGLVYQNIGDYNTAWKYLDLAYQIRLKKLGAENPYTKDTLKSINEVKKFL